jgi:hypothetical protein
MTIIQSLCSNGQSLWTRVGRPSTIPSDELVACRETTVRLVDGTRVWL